MLDSIDLLNAIKKAALDAVFASKPVMVVFGVVSKASPLEITVEQKLILTSVQLILAKSVTKLTGEVADDTGQNGNTVVIDNCLCLGDEVILLRVQGGQHYVVIDKLVKI